MKTSVQSLTNDYANHYDSNGLSGLWITGQKQLQ
jgi:hypothetical protein